AARSSNGVRPNASSASFNAKSVTTQRLQGVGELEPEPLRGVGDVRTAPALGREIVVVDDDDMLAVEHLDRLGGQIWKPEQRTGRQRLDEPVRIADREQVDDQLLRERF